MLHPSAAVVAAADAFPDLLQRWDAGVAESLFGEDMDLERVRNQLAWMRERVGECGPPAPMASGTATSARFSFVCERGVVEALLGVADPEAETVSHMRTGVRDTAPPPRVHDAGSRYTALIEAWDPETFEHSFAQSFRDKLGDGMPEFTERLRDKLGACEIGPVDLASATGAVFVLDCEHGRRTIALELNDEDRIRALRVTPLRRDPTEAPGDP